MNISEISDDKKREKPVEPPDDKKEVKPIDYSKYHNMIDEMKGE